MTVGRRGQPGKYAAAVALKDRAECGSRRPHKEHSFVERLEPKFVQRPEGGFDRVDRATRICKGWGSGVSEPNPGRCPVCTGKIKEAGVYCSDCKRAFHRGCARTAGHVDKGCNGGNLR